MESLSLIIFTPPCVPECCPETEYYVITEFALKAKFGDSTIQELLSKLTWDDVFMSETFKTYGELECFIRKVDLGMTSDPIPEDLPICNTMPQEVRDSIYELKYDNGMLLNLHFDRIYVIV